MTAISDGAMVLGDLSVPGCPADLDNSRQGPTALAIDAGASCLDIFPHICLLFSFSLSLGDSLIKTEIPS